MKKLVLGKQYLKALDSYYEFKAKKIELLHAEKKVNTIRNTIKKIVNGELVLSKKVNYRNSKGLNYFVVEKHTIFFKVKPRSINVLYFVPSLRIKTSMNENDAQ